MRTRCPSFRQGVKAGRIEFAEFAKPLARIADTLEALLADRKAAFSWSELMTGEAPAAQELRRFIHVKPILDYGALEPGAAATDVIRATAQSLALVPDRGVSVRLTGPVPMADEEFSTVADGALLNGTLTIAAVILILWLALRSGRIILAVFLSLIVGLTITAAVGLAMVGALNLISVAFAVLFVGIGVDFGIQFSVRYRQERHTNSDLGAALATAAAEVGKPLSARRGRHRSRLLRVRADRLPRRVRARPHRRHRHADRVSDEHHPASRPA